MERPLFWHQGLFLQPQHFQLDDLYLQSILTPFHRFLHPHFWGIGALETPKIISENTVERPHRAEFLFPDRTYVVYPDNAIIEARSFDEDWVEGGKPFTVYIGLKKWNDVGKNVTVLSKLENLSEVTTRFATTMEPEEVQDLHQDGPPAEIKRLFYVLKLFWQTEVDQLGDYQLIPFLQLERTGDEISLSDEFIPPTLSSAGAGALMKMVREIRDQVVSRARQLESLKRDRGIHTAEFGSRDMVYLLALRSLNRYVPSLCHLLEAPNVHPWTIYGVLRQLVGELTSFSENINVLGELADGSRLLPNYDHERLRHCFSSAQTLVVRLLDEITAGPEYIIPLVFDGTYFSAELPPAMFEGRNRYYLVFKTETDPKNLMQSIEMVAKLSSRESLPILIARALPGIRLEHLPTPPQELPRRAHSIYFQVDHHGDKWDQVEKNQNLALYWADAPDDLTVELMVVGRG